MSKKYIIKNCPNLTTSHYGTGEIIHNQCGLTDDDLCANCTNCVMKQIVDKCRKTVKIFSAESGTQPYAGGRCTEAEGILELLDIEECE